MVNSIKNKKERRGEAAWQDIVTRFEAGGMSAADFCKREGIGASSLYFWRTRLSAPLATPTQPVRKAIVPKPSMQSTTGHFIQLGHLGQDSVGTGRLELKLDLGGGISLHLVRA